MKNLLNILLIEDDTDHAEIIQYELSKVRRFKINLNWVDSLEAGKACLEDGEYDFALVDLSYPDSPPADSVIELSSWLENFNLPIVILTSLDDYDLGCDAIKMGFDDFLSKSNLSGYLLEKTITYAIERKSITQELKESRDWALEAAEAKSQFLAVMSHEIRTPLNGIVGSLNLLRESGDLNEEQQEFINTINISSDSLLRIINDILDFSKIEAGKMLFEKTVFSLRDMIKSIQYIFIPLAEGEKGIEFLTPMPATAKNYKGDPGKIRQILINLINNAIKFTSEGYVRLETEIIEHEEQVELIFHVEDSGIGISPENLKNIFESFTQEDSTVTRKYGGTGLGLSISQKLSQLMGGDLTVTSVLGTGSKFSVNLFVGKTSETIRQVVVKDNVSFSGKVLLVEDNAINTKIATKILEKMELKVETAANGQQALDKCSLHSYDLIFMDVMMPVMDGLTATKKLKDLKIETPIVAMTASAFEEDRQRCLNAGMDNFIAKPLSKQELINILSEYLD